MSKMTIIQLLNKIANGEDIPEKIKYKGIIYKFETLFEEKEYRGLLKGYAYESLFEDYNISLILNDEVEILDEKEIAEKLKIEQDTSSGNYYIKNEFGTKCYLTKHSKIFADKINEILDYLERKGE